MPIRLKDSISISSLVGRSEQAINCTARVRFQTAAKTGRGEKSTPDHRPKPPVGVGEKEDARETVQ